MSATPAGQVAAVQNVAFAAAIDDFQELVLLGPAIVHLDRGAGQLDFRLGQRQRIAQINFVNALRADRVRSPDFDLPVNAPRAQDGGINQVGAIGSQNDHHVLQRLQSIHLRAKHRHQRAGHRMVTSAVARPEY